MHWKSAQYATAEQLPYLAALNFLLATCLELASPNARVIAILNPSHVVYVVHPWSIEGSIHAQALPRHLEIA
jgi:hypothetical protein